MKKPAKKKKKTRVTQQGVINGGTPSNSESARMLCGGNRKSQPCPEDNLQVVGENGGPPAPAANSDATCGTESDSSFSKSRKHKAPVKNAPKATKTVKKTTDISESSVKTNTKSKPVLRQSPSSSSQKNYNSDISVEDVKIQDGSERRKNTLPDMFNETLRWEFTLTDERAEEERIQRYKINRRKRYLVKAQSSSGSGSVSLPDIGCAQNTCHSGKPQECSVNHEEEIQVSPGYIDATKQPAHYLILA